ncbi:MAG TPA: biotin-dependent carboxyltransferase family protein [Vicinamibacterales bacterium]|jgi:antagonist of KipI|nr:biotin-dependent carboxyltransferase family protein [Vicinamibacterales bacterium]
MTAFRVVKGGLLSTIQDLGRAGYQSVGVSVAGPMDWYSHRFANRLVGNDPDAAAIEVTLIGPELIAEGDVLCAVAGGEFEITVEGLSVPMHQPFEVRRGQAVKFGDRRSGARATLAVRGGVDVPPTLGSRATHLVSHMGPFGGRALQSGDRLPIGSDCGALHFCAAKPLRILRRPETLRVMAGPHRARFSDDGWETLCGATFHVSSESNRMGYRLEGPPLEHVRGADILSEATAVGSLQVPSSGQPILLMADRQTTGGYTIVATVITADLPLAGQLAPGDGVRFTPCSRDAALAALRLLDAQLQ